MTHSEGGRVRAAGGSALGAATGSVLAVAISAPALTRPFGPAVGLLVLAPALAAFVGTLLVSLFLRRGRLLTLASLGTASLAAAPYLLIAAAPMGRWRVAAFAGLAVVLAVTAWAARPRGAAPLIPLAGIVALLIWPRDGEVPLDGPNPMMILGFDAATWDVLDPMIAAGELPNFRRLKEEGAWGVLQSDTPSASPRVWTTIATGVSPDVHGVGGFTAGRRGLKAGRIWDEVVHGGSPAGVVGWLVNWPPDEDLVISVPGWLARGYRSIPEEATPVAAVAQSMHHPTMLPSPQVWLWASVLAVSPADHAWSHIFTKLWFKIRPPVRAEQTWRLKLQRARLLTDLAEELFRREHPRFAALVTYPTDSLGHEYWLYHQPERFPEIGADQVSRYGEVVQDAYRVADQTLGRMLDLVDLDTTTVMVVSDHGMAALPPDQRKFRLRETQMLKLLEDRELLQAFTVGRAMVIGAKVESAASSLAVRRAFDALTAADNLDRDRPAFDLDWHPRQKNTILLRLNPNGVQPTDRIQVEDTVIPIEQLCVREVRSGEHTLRGTIAVIGPGVSPGQRIQARLVDVAPTALYTLGLPVPAELEGQVVTSAFQPAWLDQHPPERREGAMRQLAAPEEEGEGSTAERLKELGYVE